MDQDRQLYEEKATGWQRGLYEDIKRTVRAPIVNWIFRTTVANHPELTRHLWAQIKPVFGTRSFGRTAIAHRAAVYEALDVDDRVERYRCGELDVSPAEFRELQGQIATYDVVASRLAVLFEVADRSLNGGSVATKPDEGRAACEPLSASFDRDRGRPPSMIETDAVPPELEDTVASIRAFHGLDSGFPSIYRTMAQWPGYLEPMWDDLEPILRSEGFESAVERSAAVIEEHVETLPYRPQLTPDALESAGFDTGAIDDFADLFATFNRGPIEKVLPALPVYAYTVDAEGPRTLG